MIAAAIKMAKQQKAQNRRSLPVSMYSPLSNHHTMVNCMAFSRWSQGVELAVEVVLLS
ncbi:hypothetical protein NSE_0102 [Neorickettsia sennetsu str. Miyayama]|uniref:Uncharacterized protein n=1 Tax=Ehrlichia sennetsu (strain ATCC VR-367 / Miyayama) TaxID=222891 RepID=Q2GEU4_EHRS3|nr:hypothetical protein NSE_0102 [Neorickettsia sennetsu str. Miyayama]